MPSPRLLPLAMLASAALAAAPVRAAEPDPAQKLFDTGLADMEAKRFDKACPMIEESYKLDPRPGVLFTLAECEAKRGRVASAVKRYDDYLTLWTALPPDKRRKQGDRDRVARTQRAALSPLLSELTLVLPPSSPKGTIVTRDGAIVAESALGVATPVDPGEHLITVQAPGGPAVETRVVVGKAEKKGLLLEVKGSPSAPGSAGPSGVRLAAYAVGAAGLAGVVAGAVTGGLAIAKKGVVDANCGLGGVPENCNHTGKSAADSLKTLALVSTLGFGAGLGMAGAGVALLVVEPRLKSASAGGARWMRPGVLAAGPSGVLLGVRGGF